MVDPALETLVLKSHQEKQERSISNSKSRFTIEIKKLIKEAVNLIVNDQIDNQLLSCESKVTQLEAEFTSSLHFSDLRDLLTLAMDTLAKSKKYLQSISYAMMIGEIIKAMIRLDTIELSKINEGNLQTVLNISESTLDSLKVVAVAKYDERAYLESLSIFALLSTLVPENEAYWYRTGITAQKCQKYELALNAYAVTAFLDPDCIEARIFSSECYLANGERSDAEAEYEQAKAYLDTIPREKQNKDQLNLLKHLEFLIKN